MLSEFQHVDSEGLFLFLFMLVIFFRRYERAVLFSLLLYYMLLKRRTDKPKIKTFQIALQAYKRVTQHMGTPLSDIDISFRKSKGFNLRSLTPQNINMSRVISVVYDPRLFLACVETSMNKYRRNSFPSQIAHNSFGTLPPFCMF